MESHGKAICLAKRFLKTEKIIDQSETGFNFSRNRHKHTFYAL